jgi:hypothetical protein
VADSGGRDFFISYTAVNRSWAEWIAVQLEAAGYSTVLQAWDFRPGSDFIHEMQQVFAAMGPLLTELDPDRIYFNLPLAEPGQPDPMTEDLRALGERAHAVREQLSMLAAWWPTSEGADLAQRLEVALLNIVIRDGWLVHDARRNRDTEPALKAARNDHQQARSLRAEVRGQAAPARSSPRVGCAVLWYGQAR